MYFKTGKEFVNTYLTISDDKLSRVRKWIVDSSLTIWNSHQVPVLPENLTVKGWLHIFPSSYISFLPENLTVTDSLNICGTQITSLPESLVVGGLIYVCHSQIMDVPERFKEKVIW